MRAIVAVYFVQRVNNFVVIKIETNAHGAIECNATRKEIKIQHQIPNAMFPLFQSLILFCSSVRFFFLFISFSSSFSLSVTSRWIIVHFSDSWLDYHIWLTYTCKALYMRKSQSDCCLFFCFWCSFYSIVDVDVVVSFALCMTVFSYIVYLFEFDAIFLQWNTLVYQSTGK